MQPLLIINVVGLTSEMLGPHAPHLTALAKRGFHRPMSTVLPAVTCSAQATMLTGDLPAQHGIVGNGWYDRDYADVFFWKQSNHLIQGETLYKAARKRDIHHTTAKMFWWYNMYAPIAYSMTPRPSYPADGRKIFDSYSQPATLRDELQNELGVFPLQHFWGPLANIKSSRWITDASLQVMRTAAPSLVLVYLPHLDYNLQRLGATDQAIGADIQAVDAEAGRLIDAAGAMGYETLVVSEYAITNVSQPVHINRVLREHGWLTVRREPLGYETLDAGASRAFAVVDHQVAHVYVRDQSDLPEVESLLKRTAGVEFVLSCSAQKEFGIDHSRSGDLVVIAADNCWFTYYFWVDDRLAPDYARTIDIHRKPGYDPLELLVDPAIWLPQVRIARRLAQKKLGFRYYMDVISLDATLIKGSHGRLPTPGRETREGPVFISSTRSIERDRVQMQDVKELALQIQFGSSAN